jgi:hypothetical protein
MTENFAVADVLNSLPCSLELPAGCGKTEVIAQLVMYQATRERPSLVLTHTHAGVDAIRRRLARRGIPKQAYNVQTLDSWCFDLIARFPQLAGLAVPPEPIWADAQEYHAAGARAVGTAAVKKMLRVSYCAVFVDEYQDCQLWQHQLVQRISTSVPTCILGDRMQGLFFFAGRGNSVIWERDVLDSFPPFILNSRPWRWQSTNPELGEWLVDVRSRLMRGLGIDLSLAPLVLGEPNDLRIHAAKQPSHPQRSVVIRKWPKGCARAAMQIGAGYTMMEELEGRHLLQFAAIVDSQRPATVAEGCIAFAISCASGLASSFRPPDRHSLGRGVPIPEEKYPGLIAQVRSLNELLKDCDTRNVEKALRALAAAPGFRLHRREAWFGVLQALRLTGSSRGLTLREAVVSTRNTLRHSGRFPESRIVARPLLIKGLEFDNAVVDDVQSFDSHELYVSLTRASRVLTVLSAHAVLTPTRPC